MQAQAPPRDARPDRADGTALIAGVVRTVEQEPRPVRPAIVTLTGSGLPRGLQSVTDDDGRFAFQALSAGRYTLTAEKPAYVKSFYGSWRPGRGPGIPIALADAQRVTDIQIGLLRGAVLEGTVLDGNGVPLSSAQVSVRQSVLVDGERRLIDPPGVLWPARFPFATTDDRGRYRVYGLPPGQYAVHASGGSSQGLGVRVTTPAMVSAAMRELRDARSVSQTQADAGPAVTLGGAYFLGVPDAAAAELVTLGPGEERSSIDIPVGLVRISTSKVDNLAVDSGGQPMALIFIGKVNLSTGSMLGSLEMERPGPDGRFVWRFARPGRYLLFGRGTADGKTAATPDSNLTLWTSTEVIVNEEETTEVVLQFLPGVTVSGGIKADRAGAAVDFTKLRFSLRPIPSSAGAVVSLPPITPQAGGTFAFAGVAPGKYRMSLSGGDPWVLRSAIVEGCDTLAAPLEVQPGRNVADVAVTLTDRPAEISGTLLDSLGRPAPEYAIVVFSTDRSHWTNAPRRVSGVVRVGANGAFTVRGLPPGEYYLTALTDLDPAQLADSAVLDQLATTSLKIVLGEGERKVQNLKLPQ